MGNVTTLFILTGEEPSGWSIPRPNPKRMNNEICTGDVIVLFGAAETLEKAMAQLLALPYIPGSLAGRRRQVRR